MAALTEARTGGFLEVVDRSGQVRERVPVPPEGLTVGRAYDNEVIVDDPFVCPHHIVVRWADGELIAEDRDSVNGLYAGAGRSRAVARAGLGDGASVRIGHTRLRFRPRDYPVPQTRVDHQTRSFWRVLRHNAWRGGIYALTLAVLAVTAYADGTRAPAPARWTYAVLAPLGLTMVWAAAWALVNRVTMHRLQFLSHLALGCVAISAMLCLEPAVEIAAYSLDLDAAVIWAQRLGNATLLALVVFAHLRLVSHASGARLISAAAGAGLAVALFAALTGSLDGDRFSAQPQYRATVKPPHLMLRDSQSPETFFRRARPLGEAASRAARDDDQEDD